MRTKNYSIFLLLLLLSCKKSETCQTWEYYDNCAVLDGIPDYSCNGTGYLTGKFCGDDLKGDSVGAQKVISEDRHERVTRYFVKRIN